MLRHCLLTLTLIVVACCPALAATDKYDQPNIVFILADDLGYGDPGCYNPDSKIPTPHIDRLAAEGMRFTDAHVSGAWCVPSRYGLLAGRYPSRLGDVRANRPLIESGRLTIASLLKQVGYRTAMIGKWHLGFAHEADPGDHRLDGGPVDCGFDEYFGIPKSLDRPPYYYIRNDRAVKPPTKPIAAGSRTPWTKGREGASWHAGLIAEDFVMDQVLPRITDEAVAFLKRHHEQAPDQPFLLYFPLTAPHEPWLPLPEYRGKSGAGTYGDFVMQVDDVVGRVLRTLDELKLTGSTLVLFASDNGPVWYAADIERFGHRAAGPWRGIKGDAYEGGHRVPLLVRWPGQTPAGTVNDRPVTLTDLLATLAAITGQSLPDDAGEDSFDMLSVLRGEGSAATGRKAMMLYTGEGNLIRAGDWKLIPWLGTGGFLTKPRRVKPGPDDPPGQLYNLADDPTEQNNLYTARPDIVRRLSHQLDILRNRKRSAPGSDRP